MDRREHFLAISIIVPLSLAFEEQDSECTDNKPYTGLKYGADLFNFDQVLEVQ